MSALDTVQFLDCLCSVELAYLHNRLTGRHLRGGAASTQRMPHHSIFLLKLYLGHDHFSISLLSLSSDELGLLSCLFFIFLLIYIDGAGCLTIADPA
ncbi:hypothetical protein BI308_06320 [Roseofilum reptotaenium AO1-A]|uniref:Uncharacterized protein n=1 Tax=Roseofilum reptotaenium AO1-A TaxID=1925591 RepID=A0A1L9QUW7_9CYAN|nr:hypothetical protein BI308_06320 [Roseofilum reptotaenium AO1-A]